MSLPKYRRPLEQLVHDESCTWPLGRQKVSGGAPQIGGGMKRQGFDAAVRRASGLAKDGLHARPISRREGLIQGGDQRVKPLQNLEVVGDRIEQQGVE